MMTGRYHLPLLRMCILSISKNWNRLPKIIITNDGSTSIVRIRKALRFYKGELIVEDWEETEIYHKQAQRNGLIKYAKADPFGKKMAIILRYASLFPTLWVDSDILFFKDFTVQIPTLAKGINLGGSEDWRGAYHEEMLTALDAKLPEKLHFNAGLLYASGIGIYEVFEIEDLLTAVHPNYNFLSEQTIFAHIANRSLGIIWDRKIIENSPHDIQQLRPQAIKELIGRHYTSNVRHLFWRDAIFLI
ncbi:hypothetical protein [Pedobacter frigidisoli]|nr:hypothetical protein [Pedobacter frigidisoli]